MQDKYTGDVGDFAKYGLLRQLIRPIESRKRLRLAVLWYLVDDEDGNSDGKHISYLRDTRIRACDPALFDTLKRLVGSGDRNVASLEMSGVLPLSQTVFFSVRLLSVNSRRPQNSSTTEARREWFLLALEASKTSDLVFFDPDNGIEIESVRRSSPKSTKYVYLDEVAAIAERGKSLLIYHHHNRTASGEVQVQRALNKLISAAPQCTDVFAITFRRGSVRSFFLLSSKSRSSALRANLTTLQSSPWGSYFSVTKG